MAILTTRHSNFRSVHKKYTVSGPASSGAFKTDTLDEAKRAGMQIAKRNVGRGRWNMLYITVVIDKQDAPGSMYYRLTGWKMYVPVAGSGRRYDSIVAEIKRRHGVAPMVWTKK